MSCQSVLRNLRPLLCDAGDSSKTQARCVTQAHRCCIFVLSTSCRVELGQPDSEDSCCPVMHIAQVHKAVVSELAACLKGLQQLIWVPD